MAFVFEVGQTYDRADKGFDPVTVTKRTAKTIWVTNGRSDWSMRIRKDGCGGEWAVEGDIPHHHQFALRIHAANVAEI